MLLCLRCGEFQVMNTSTCWRVPHLSAGTNYE